MVRYVLRYLREFDINEDTIPLDLIDEVGHSGEFLTKDHTFQYCHSEPLNPTISSRGRVSDNLHQLDINIEKRYNQLMDSYVQPQLDAATLEKVKEILTSHGVDRSLLDKIETM